MPLYTRTGDHGSTGTLAGRVRKNDLQVAALGALDTLHAHLAVVYEETYRTPNFSKTLETRLRTDLPAVMHDLLDLGTHVSALRVVAPSGWWHSTTMELRDPKYLFTAKYLSVETMEELIDSMEQSTPELRNFILHTGSPLTAQLHVARTACRAAESALVAFLNQADDVEEHDQILLRYLNRLSDYLFALARLCTHVHEGLETIH